MKNRSIRTNSWLLFPEYELLFEYSKDDLDLEFKNLQENETIPELQKFNPLLKILIQFKDEMYIISHIFLHPLSSLPNYF